MFQCCVHNNLKWQKKKKKSTIVYLNLHEVAGSSKVPLRMFGSGSYSTTSFKHNIEILSSYDVLMSKKVANSSLFSGGTQPQNISINAKFVSTCMQVQWSLF